MEKKRKKLLHLKSDHLTLLNAYLAFEEAMADPRESVGKFCKDHYLNEKSLRKARKIKLQLEHYLESIEKHRDSEACEEELKEEEKSSLIVSCLYKGLPLNQAKH